MKTFYYTSMAKEVGDSAKGSVMNEKASVDPDKSSPAMDKEITLSVNPKKILKAGLFVLLLLGVFFIGRWSTDLMGVGLTGLATADDLDEAAEGETEEVVTETETMELDAADEEGSANTEADSGTVEDPESTEEDSSDESTETTEEEVNEPIITTYSKVAVSLNSVQVDWKGTWGKITQLNFNVKNSEEGTIKPAYFVMLVEGYTEESERKEIPLKENDQTVRGGQTLTGSVRIPGGFNYNQATTGDLKKVNIMIILYDIDDKPMASYSKDYNLYRE